MKAASLGVRHVELTFVPSLEGRTRSISNALASSGLTAPSMHGPFGLTCDIGSIDPEQRRKALTRHSEYLRYCAALGTKIYVIHPGLDNYGRSRGGGWDDLTKTGTFPREPNTIDSLWETNASSLADLADSAVDLGVKIALETFSPNIMTPTEIIQVVRMADRKNIGVCVDTGHINVGNRITPAAAIREAGPLLWALHLHDNNGDGDFHLTPGKGNIDWAAVSKALREVSYGGTFNLEGSDALDWLDWAREGISFLSRIFE